ncbi:cupin [Verrucomicrobia bacterium SCGC AG-212-E04]|nr:cupin [Verrucomicrobia bacterium SCGC AG-212-E04]
MEKINTNRMSEVTCTSPTGRFASIDKEISQALGRDAASTDLQKRHPFDLAICRIPPGRSLCPYHSHSAQWEFYLVISGSGRARHEGGFSPIEAGDAFLFPPGEAHQLTNDGADDLVFYIVADNPLGESCYYPDSRKWLVRSPERRLIRGEALDYFDGEE